MKKFLAIVMCLAMALSMMTVVSFAADAVQFNFGTVECKAGETVVVPMAITSDIGVKTGGAKIKETNLPAGITLATKDAAVHVDGINEDIFDVTTKAHSYVKATKFHTFSFKTWEDVTLSNEPVMDITFTVDASVEPGTYTIPFTYSAKNAATATLAAECGVACTIVVKGAEPTVEATSVKSADENGQPVALYILQPKNAKACGIIYVGENAKYKNEKFASLADPSDAMAAVKVIGLDDAFEAYAE